MKEKENIRLKKEKFISKLCKKNGCRLREATAIPKAAEMDVEE